MEALIRPLPREWLGAVLVCAKCTKKIGGGFGPKGRTPLANLLRKAPVLNGRNARAGVIKTRCLGVCPKYAVTVVDARRSNRWLIVPQGTPFDSVIARLASEE